VLKIVTASGCHLTDADGRRFIDASSQGGLVGLGHNNPVLSAAMKDQLGQLPYMHGRFDFETTVQIAGRPRLVSRARVREVLLNAARPAMKASQVWLNISGAAGIMTALKACRISRTLREAPLHEREQLLQASAPFPQFAVIAFQGAYHGLLGDAQLLTDCRPSYRVASAPGMHVERLPFPYQGMTANARAEYLRQARSVLDEVVRQFGWRAAAFVFEPILGFGHVADPQTLISLCGEARQRGIYLVADEFKTGQGRTGKHFACMHTGIEPDVMVFSKILSGGFPCAAITATDAIRVEPLPEETYWDLGTFVATPMACVSMMTTLEVIQTQELVENAARQGERLRAHLQHELGGLRAVTGIDGAGLLLSVILRDETTRDRLHTELIRRGVVGSPQGRGWGKPLMLLMPPLVIDDETTDRLAQTVGYAARAVAAEHGVGRKSQAG
jgi:4-aminobutyrate aminotransferase